MDYLLDSSTVIVGKITYSTETLKCKFCFQYLDKILIVDEFEEAGVLCFSHQLKNVSTDGYMLGEATVHVVCAL